MSDRQEIVFNVARRLTQDNEPDLLQEEMVSSPPPSPATEKHCMDLISNLIPGSPLPAQCDEFAVIKSSLQRKDSKHNQAIAFQGMHAGEAASAMAARDHGQFHHAQIQRRMTNTKKRTLW